MVLSCTIFSPRGVSRTPMITSFKYPTNCNLMLRNAAATHYFSVKTQFKFQFSTLFSILEPYRRRAALCRHRQPVRSLFTGIVEEMGEIVQLGPSENDGFDLRISANTVLGGIKLGDSIAVNGTCLTVTHFGDSEFTVGLSPETLRKTSLGELGIGSLVNLERALLPDTRMGGHFVQGHVDCTGEIVSMVPEEDSLWVKVRVPREMLRFIVPKGFIAVDGTSLTVVDVYDEEECFDFMLVAYTQQKVVIPLKKVGEKVNLEVDILGKYVERLIECRFDADVLPISSPSSSS